MGNAIICAYNYMKAQLLCGAGRREPGFSSCNSKLETGLSRFKCAGMTFALLNEDGSLKTESSKTVDRFPRLFYNRAMKWILPSMMLAIMTVPVYGQQGQYSTPDDSLYANVIIPRAELRWVMDVPTAGILPRGSFDMDMRTFPVGGVQTTLNIGLGHRFMVGVGYGGSRVLTDSDPEWNPKVEFLLRFRLHEESEGFPALAVGYSSIGYGPYDQEFDRYAVKSPGFYFVFSKNFSLYQNPAAWHGGINYSLENKHDNDPDLFIGFNADVGPNMTYLAEYDFAFNDTERYGVYGSKKRGYMNMGLAWYITQELSLELDLKNLLQNRSNSSAIDREIRLVYTEYFY